MRKCFRKISFFIIFILTITVPGSAINAQNIISPKYFPYCNHRYNYCINFPPHLLTAQQEAASGDGKILLDKKGVEFLRVFRRGAVDPEEHISLKKQMQEDISEITQPDSSGVLPEITYKKLGRKFYVLSGKKGDIIFYRKVIITKDDELAFALFQYHEKDKNRYDKVVAKMAASFQ